MRSLVAVLTFVLLSCTPEQPYVQDTVGGGGSASAGAADETRAQPLMGGTVTTASSGDDVLVSDPDRDLLFYVRLTARGGTVKAKLSLPKGSVPTRGVDDGQGHFAVVLRGTGKVAFVDQATQKLSRVVDVCAEPRGLSRTVSGTGLLVACATGELVELSGAEKTVRLLGVEGRDVVATNAGTWVSSFRSAELLEVRSGKLTRPAPEMTTAGSPARFAAQVAWRTLLAPNGEVVMVHQLERTDELTQPVEPPPPPASMEAPPPPPPPTTSLYGGGVNVPHTPGTVSRPPCTASVIRTGVTVFGPSGARTFEVRGVLPIDAAISPTNDALLIASAGNSEVVRVDLLASTPGVTACGPNTTTEQHANEQPMGVAFASDGRQLVHFRVPNLLVVRTESGAEVGSVLLTPDLVNPPGFRLFHDSTGIISCASCHPEGHEDGHVWTIRGNVRRTQSLAGGVMSTAPFHWAGDHHDLRALMADTFVQRMGGVMPDTAHLDALGRFLDAIPAPAPRAGVVDEALGHAAFVKANCQTCHAGPRMVSGSTMSVGRGEAFQVPMLVGVSRRGPWMHDGCAKTLRDRFSDTACGGNRHGDVSRLSSEELDALVGWLETR